MEQREPVVIATGFGPFGIHLKNASWEAVKLLQHMNLESECGIKLITKEIPVAYDEIDKIVPELWKQHKPVVRIDVYISEESCILFFCNLVLIYSFQLMVHAGVSHIAQHLTLESCANRSGYCGEDVKECKLLNGINSLGDEEHLKTNIDLNLIKEEAKSFDVNLFISDDARRYLLFLLSLQFHNYEFY